MNSLVELSDQRSVFTFNKTIWGRIIQKWQSVFFLFGYSSVTLSLCCSEFTCRTGSQDVSSTFQVLTGFSGRGAAQVCVSWWWTLPLSAGVCVSLRNVHAFLLIFAALSVSVFSVRCVSRWCPPPRPQCPWALPVAAYVSTPQVWRSLQVLTGTITAPQWRQLATKRLPARCCLFTLQPAAILALCAPTCSPALSRQVSTPSQRNTFVT